MVADSEDLPPRLAQAMMWATLGLLFLIRLMNGWSNGFGWPHLLVTMAPYPALVVVLARRYQRPGVRYLLLAAVSVLYALPFLLLGAQWAWLPWPVAVAVLCLLPGRAAWPLLGLIMAGAGVGGLVQGDNAKFVLWQITATGTDALIFFGLYGLVGMVRDVHLARSELSRLAALRERLRLDGELRQVVGDSLRTIADRLARARRVAPDAARAEVQAAIDTAGRTMAGIRATASEYRSATPPAAVIESPRLARAMLLAILLLQSVKVLAFISLTPDIGHPSLLILGLPLLSGMVVLQMTLMRRPTRARLLLLGLLLVPAALPGSYFVPVLYGFATVWGFLSGAVLAHWRPPRSWAVVGLLLAGHFAALLPYPPVSPWTAMPEELISHVILAWLVYCLTRLADLVVLLDRTRHELAQTAIAAERSRIARDLHDVLGFSLSAVVLRGELVLRLLDHDPERAAAESGALCALAERAQVELGSITGGRIRLSLRAEIEASLEVLAAAGVAVETNVDVGPLPADLDTALATVLRESVTNILRHSKARTCAISVTGTDRAVRLRVRNDGAGPARSPGGSGLAGLAERTGGRLSAGHRPGGGFEVVAELGSDPIGLGGDPDRVDPVAGAQLGRR
ncbi:histidine kinase [Actinoallomurus sp. NPDC052274]|uniref:sensor histidine kinase n=1 Tax=Actinoallomurus sp. NPDC052274 TaxID=3155420 RepID=UPI00342ABB7D